MKILYLTPGCFDKGGISRYSRYQITALRDLLGVTTVRVLSLLGPDGESFEDPFPVHWHGEGATPKSRIALVLNTAAGAIRWRPDVIWSAHLNFSGLTTMISRIAGARSCLNIYGLEVWSDHRHFSAYGLRRSDLVVSDCHFTARYAAEKGLRAGPTSVIWDCVDTGRFSPGRPSREVVEKYRLPDPESGVNLLTFGRMTQGASHKGYDRLLEAFSRIADRCPTLRLIYAGRGELVDQLRADAERRGFGARVHFSGMIAEADLPDLYRSAHVFSLVSDRGIGRGEGIPLTPLEAAASGLPIIVGNHDGSQEAVDMDGSNGYVIDPFDLDRHAQIISELWQNEELRRAKGRAARKRIECAFSYQGFREKHAVLLDSLRSAVEH